MFDFKAWLKTGLINGYKHGSFSMPHVITMTANYIAAGMLIQDDAAEIAAACAAWDEEQAKIDAEAVDPGFSVNPEDVSEAINGSGVNV